MKIVLQWHITEKCNFRCKHCYQDNYENEGANISSLIDVFHQYMAIKKNTFKHIFDRRIINFVWWEPFIRKDFVDFLEYINSKVTAKDNLEIWILTNGSLLNNKILLRLKKLNNIKISFSISLEWTKKNNDLIRWKWTFEIIEKSILLCQEYNFPVRLSFTISKKNIKEVFKLIPFIEKYGLEINIRRFVPMWVWKEQFVDFELTAEEWYKFTVKVLKTNLLLKNSKINVSWCSEVTWYKYKWWGCAINYHRLLIILPNLLVYPCRKIEIPIWDLNKEKLIDIFFSKKYKELLTIHENIKICRNCAIYDKCRWWAKCITYAHYNRLDLPDPWCYKAKLLIEKNVSKT
jgi:MoaA/NifB/PqqE/SkfB family radical SAM enzyme